MPRQNRIRDVLKQIADLAQSAVDDRLDNRETDRPDAEPVITCTPRALPVRLQQQAAQVARRVNPVNAPLIGATAGLFGDVPLEPLQIAVITAKYWGRAQRRLTVSFMEATDPALRNRIISHMNAWATRIGISFVYTAGTGQVRISRGGSGYWSYLGTDVLLIPTAKPTMNLQGFTMSTPESEYRRVVRHETGHTLGCPHEHMRKAIVDGIDKNKAYAYFWQTQGWNKATVDQQVLTPLNEASIMGTPGADKTSIMCYQLPGSIMKNGQPVPGGLDINATDYTFMASIYPKVGAGMQYTADVDGGAEQAAAMQDFDGGAGHDEPLSAAEDWDPSEDVHPDDVELAV